MNKNCWKIPVWMGYSFDENFNQHTIYLYKGFEYTVDQSKDWKEQHDISMQRIDMFTNSNFMYEPKW